MFRFVSYQSFHLAALNETPGQNCERAKRMFLRSFISTHRIASHRISRSSSCARNNINNIGKRAIFMCERKPSKGMSDGPTKSGKYGERRRHDKSDRLVTVVCHGKSMSVVCGACITYLATLSTTVATACVSMQRKGKESSDRRYLNYFSHITR